MPKLIFPEQFDTQIEPDIKLGYRTTGTGKTWYARIYWRNGEKNSYYTLKTPYEPSQASFRLASTAARKKYKEFYETVKTGASPTTTLTLASMSQRYLKQIRKEAELNEAATDKQQLPRYKDNRNGFWTIKKVKFRERLHEQIEPFFGSRWGANITTVDQRYLGTFLAWALENTEWAPSTINYHITEIKQIWLWAFRKGYVDQQIGEITRAAQDLRGRSRRHLKEDEWDQMIDWAAKRYRDRKASGTKDTESIDLAYQYWMWLHVIGYTGVRPPFGQVKKNLLEWKSYELLEEGTAQEMRTFKRFDEKGKKDYEAVIMPECWDVFDLMEQHRKQNDLEPTYLFQHTQNKANSWKKGDPVLNFRTSWRTMLKELGLEMPKGTPQHEKLVPYCLRGYFITMRLRDGDMRIEDLSEATGTSPEVVREIYYEFSTRKTYKKLTSGSHNARTITRQRDANGYAII
jgi:integrase